MLAILEKIDPEIIDHFRTTGQSAAMDVSVQKYIRQLDRAAELYATFGNITRCAKALQKHFHSDKLAFNTARARVYDAIEHFHINANVSTAAWDQYYADRFEDMAKLAIASDDLQTAEKCYTHAHRLRTRNQTNDIDPKLLQPPIMIFSTDISAEALGFEKKSMKDIARKYEEGKYTQLIDKLPITDEDRQRLYRDAGLITDAEIIDENDD
jgi:hypothetical protein